MLAIAVVEVANLDYGAAHRVPGRQRLGEGGGAVLVAAELPQRGTQRGPDLAQRLVAKLAGVLVVVGELLGRAQRLVVGALGGDLHRVRRRHVIQEPVLDGGFEEAVRRRPGITSSQGRSSGLLGLLGEGAQREPWVGVRRDLDRLRAEGNDHGG